MTVLKVKSIVAQLEHMLNQPVSKRLKKISVQFSLHRHVFDAEVL
jgi:hypothetical protein